MTATTDPVQAAAEALAGFDQLPVPVEDIAARYGARLAFQPLDNDTSAMLWRQGDVILIGVNSAHTRTRQRFSIAHELGHLVLHPGKPLLIDKTIRVDFRDRTSSMATDAEEMAANAFAANLLMPDARVREAAKALRRRTGADEDSELVPTLASQFAVSAEAMGYRLANLGLMQPS